MLGFIFEVDPSFEAEQAQDDMIYAILYSLPGVRGALAAIYWLLRCFHGTIMWMIEENVIVRWQTYALIVAVMVVSHYARDMKLIAKDAFFALCNKINAIRNYHPFNTIFNLDNLYLPLPAYVQPVVIDHEAANLTLLKYAELGKLDENTQHHTPPLGIPIVKIRTCQVPNGGIARRQVTRTRPKQSTIKHRVAAPKGASA